MKKDKIAIIGVAARFPGAKNIEIFKNNLIEGKKAFNKKPLIREFFGNNSKNFYLDNIDKFDYEFFEILRTEAEFMSPSQRLLLEVINETLDNAAYSRKSLDGSKVAIFCAAGRDGYDKFFKKDENRMNVVGGSDSFMLSRISKFYNWKGINTMVDTTCSSSLVCLNLAKNELLLGNADYAIVCGVNILPFYEDGSENDIGIWSKNGVSMPFSSKNDGMTRGEVVSAVMLKKYQKAIEDKDFIHAILRAISVNNNASNTQSLSEPDSKSQSEVIIDCWKKANINPQDIDFIEAHGSGTILGDSLEVEGINKAFDFFNKNKNQKLNCPISSVKSNIGHGLSASGLSGLVKAILCLKNRIIFPNTYYRKLDSLFNFKNSYVYVNKKKIILEEKKDKKTLVGVTSLGISGVNAHALLEEGCAGGGKKRKVLNHKTKNSDYFFAISGQSENILKKNLVNLLNWLINNKHENIANVSYSLCAGRTHQDYRFSCVCNSTDNLVEEIRRYLAVYKNKKKKKRIIFVFKNKINVYSNIDKILAKFNEKEFIKIKRQKLNKKLILQLCFYRMLLSKGVNIYFSFDKDILKNCQSKILKNILTKDLYLESFKNSLTIVFTNKEMERFDYGFNCNQINFIEKNIFKISELFYVNGGEINWNIFFNKNKVAKTELPAYEFKKLRCWHSSVKENNLKNKKDEKIINIKENREKLLKSIWADKLSMEYSKIKENDNFFKLGGDSLLATAVLKDLNNQLKVKLDFEDIFDFPTIYKLFKYIDNKFFNQKDNIINTVKEIWKEVLNLKKCYDNDNFFSLGGHSLIASLIIKKIKYIFLVDLDFVDIFNNPTPKELSLFIFNKKKKENKKSEKKKKIKRGYSIEEKKIKLSSLQERLYFLEKIEENSSPYNAFDILELPSNINFKILEKAINFLIKRHELLRASIVEDKFKPLQIIRKDFKYSLKIVDVERIKKNRFIKKNISDKIDFSDKLFNFQIIREKRENGIRKIFLLLVFHYIILDDKSLDIFNTELFIVYYSFINKKKPALPILYKRYLDFIDNENLGNEEEQKKYWKEKMKGDIPFLNLSNNKKRKKISTGRVKTISLEKKYFKEIKKVCEQEGVTIYVFMATIFSLFLSKISGQKDVLFSTPISLRDELDYQNVFGFFINTVVLRFKIKNDISFSELLSEAKEEILDSLKNKHYSIDKLIEELKPDRSVNRPYFLNIMYQNDPLKKEEVFKSVKNVLFYKKNIQFDIKLRTREKENNTMLFFIEYSEELFSSKQIDIFFDILKFILKQVLNNKKIKIKEIDILSDKEKENLKNKFNNTKKNYFGKNFLKNNILLINQFEEQVKKTPKRIAIEFEDKILTYEELNNKSNKLANFLNKEKKIVKKEIIGILQERTIESIISILAILKIGCAYLPIDLKYPSKRIEYMISQSKIKLIIGDSEKESLIKKEKVEFLNIKKKEIRKEVERQSLEKIKIDINKNDLVYIIYTSGSTGEPKGVKIQNKAILNTLCWLQEEFELTDRDVVAQKTALSFTDSVWEIFWPLVKGSKLSIISDKIAVNPEEFIKELNKKKITFTQFVPALMILFLESKKIKKSEKNKILLPYLKYIFNGGEALSPSLSNEWYAAFPNVKIANIYGMTESAIYTTNYIVPNKTDESQISVPLGKPIANNQIYILDKNNKMLPRTILGEISVSGESLSNGYLHKKKETEEVFVFNKRLKTNIYKTGDLGIIDDCYNLHYLGRAGSQVQIRGYRIEMGEIEAKIREKKSVSNCAVIIREEKKRKELCAFYTEKENGVLLENKLERYLKENLPEYMVPKYIYRIKKFPLNVHGKIDRKKLKKYYIIEKKNKNKKNIKTKTEKQLAKIWEKILGFQVFDRKSDFFNLGGHSLSVIEMIYLIEKKFGIKFIFSDIFDYPKLCDMAEKIDESLISENIY
jgi:amino acid adenylation domain-containing protein